MDDAERTSLNREITVLRAESEARIQALERKTEVSEKAATAARLESDIRGLLGKHRFASDKASDTAFTIYSNAIQRDPHTGTLVAGSQPAAKFLENDLSTNHPYLLASKDDGERVRGRGGKGVANTKYDLDRNSSGYALKPGNFQKYTREEQSEIREMIRGMP